MATDIDSLQIQINATATKANSAVDNLIKKLDRLTTALSAVDGSKLIGLANGVQRLGTAMQTMNNVKTTDFTRLAKNLTTLNNLDVSKLGNVSANITQIGNAVSGISNVSQGVTQITELANGIKQLGYTSIEKAIKNIPDLAKAMKDLMSELSTAPKVSQNLIDMTNALAKLARTGASSGKAATALTSVFDRIGVSSGNAVRGIKKVNLSLSGLTRKILPFISLYKMFDLGKQAVEISSSLTEIQNVVDVTFGDYRQKIEDLASVSIPELGMSELTTKQIASRFQAMGTAMGFTKGKMADMSVELTRLTGDMASFYDMEQKDVGKALQSIFTGETEPMRKYGIDLTNATIKQWALNNGLNANISSMSQAEKAMLRYQYVMANTGAAQGDFLRTQDTWSNQVRILKQQLQQLASVIGGSLINALKPLVKALNSVMSHIIAFAETISNALGAIFGWKFEKSGGGAGSDIASELENSADSADNMSDGIGNAANNAEKLRKTLTLLPFDQLNQMASVDQASGSGSSGSGSGGMNGTNGTANALGGQWTKTDSILEEFESEIDSLYELGSYISDALSKAMESINWYSVYEKARNFGTGLANFLNGLINPRLFGNLGKTIAGSINTALNGINAFAINFNWKNLGDSIASGINNFFKTTDFELAADTFTNTANGILDSLISAISGVEWEEVGMKIKDFLERVPWMQLLGKVGTLIWEAIKGAIRATWEIFKGDEIEDKIVAVVLGLKFSRIGFSIGYKIWNVLVDSILGKVVTSYFGKKINSGISEVIGESVETVTISKTGQSFWNNFFSIFNIALAESAAFGGIALLAEKLAELADKAQGGNGKLTELGGIMDSISQYYSPKVSDEIFSLKEKLEDAGAGADEFADAFVKYFLEAGISAESLTTAFNNLAGSYTVTNEQQKFFLDLIEKVAEGTENAESRTTVSYDKIREALRLLAKDGVITGVDAFNLLNGTLDEQEMSGANATDTISALKEMMIALGIVTDSTEGIISDRFGEALGGVQEKATSAGNAINTLSNDAFANLSENAKNASTDNAGLFDTLGKFNVGNLLGIIGLQTIAGKTQTLGEKSKFADEETGYLSDTLSQISTSDPIKQIENLDETLKDLGNTAETEGTFWGTGWSEGMKKSTSQVEKSVTDFTNTVKGGTKEQLGINSPSTISFGFGENWIQGFVNGGNAKLTSLLDSMRNIWKKVKDVFSKTEEEFSKIGENMVFGLKTGLADSGVAITAAKDMKDQIVKIFDGISLRKYGQNAAKTFAHGISSVHIPMPHITVDSNTYSTGSGYSYKMSSNVKWYRNGGFPSGEIWGMNENGNPEMIGKVGNKTAVANNEIISEAIKDAVVEGMTQVLMNQSTGTGKAPQYIMNSINIDGKEVAKAVTKAQESRDSRFNPSPAY